MNVQRRQSLKTFKTGKIQKKKKKVRTPRHNTNLYLKSHTIVSKLKYPKIDMTDCFENCTNCCLVCCAGVHDKGAVEITNCFTVPHNEFEDEVCTHGYIRALLYDV